MDQRLHVHRLGEVVHHPGLVAAGDVLGGEAGERVLIPTGFCLGIPDGYEIQVRPRSGLAVKHGITVINAPGTIDSKYRGELMVGLVNHSSECFTVKHGDRIAQIVMCRVEHPETVEVEDLEEKVLEINYEIAYLKQDKA